MYARNQTLSSKSVADGNRAVACWLEQHPCGRVRNVTDVIEIL